MQGRLAEFFPRGLTALDDLDEQTLGTRPNMSHVTAREEVIGLVAIGDDFFVIVRVIGSGISLFVSDLTASVDWPLAVLMSNTGTPPPRNALMW